MGNCFFIFQAAGFLCRLQGKISAKPYTLVMIYITHITVILTLFQKQIEFESQSECTILLMYGAVWKSCRCFFYDYISNLQTANCKKKNKNKNVPSFTKAR